MKIRSAQAGITRSIGVLFTGVHAVFLLFGLSALLAAKPGAVEFKVFLPAVGLGLLVGIVYLAGQVHPALRLVPSILWIVAIGIPVMCSCLLKGNWRGSAPVSLIVLICVLLMIGALVWHASVDAKALLARSRAQDSGAR